MCAGALSGCGSGSEADKGTAEPSAGSAVTTAAETSASEETVSADDTEKALGLGGDDTKGITPPSSALKSDLSAKMKNIKYESFSGTESKNTRAAAAKMGETDAFSTDDDDVKTPDWDSVKKQSKKKMTLMIYMVGSDLESRSNAASLDLLEIAESGLASDDVNVVLCCGGSSEWALPLSSKKLNYLVYENGDFRTYSSAKKSMGKSSTLRSTP